MRCSLCLLAFTLSSTLAAQTLLPIGPSVGGGDDAVLGPFTLPFAFPFPGGTTTSAIEISTNGQIFPAGTTAGSSRPLETVAELLAGPPGIYPYWDDLDDPQGVDDQVHLDTSMPNLAVITYVDTAEWSFAAPNPAFTVQVTLAPDGRVSMVWDARTALASGDAIVGLSAGGGSTTPPVDFTQVALGGSLASGPTVYEAFPADGFDLVDGTNPAALLFTPDGSGGYIVSGNPAPPAARAEPGREACDAPFRPRALTLTPAGAGYTVSSGGTFDSAFAAGTAIALGDESESAPIALPFAFPFPGGSSSNAIVVTSNGRILPAGTTETASFDVLVADFRDDPVAQIAPLWTDLDPGSPFATGPIHVHDLGAAVSVTFDGIPAFARTAPNTFQAILRSDGSLEFHYRDLALGDAAPKLIGVSPGGLAGVDPEGPSDLTGVPTASADALVYEFFAPGSDFDLENDVNDFVELVAIQPPVLGATFDVAVTGTAGPGATAFVFFGLPTGLAIPSIDLGVLDPALASCELLTDVVSGFPFATAAAPAGTSVTIADLTNAPVALAGFGGLSVSAIFVDPQADPALVPTDELVVTFGF